MGPPGKWEPSQVLRGEHRRPPLTPTHGLILGAFSATQPSQLLHPWHPDTAFHVKLQGQPRVANFLFCQVGWQKNNTLTITITIIPEKTPPKVTRRACPQEKGQLLNEYIWL